MQMKLVQESGSYYVACKVRHMYNIVQNLHKLYMFSLNKKQDSEGNPSQPVILDVSIIRIE